MVAHFRRDSFIVRPGRDIRVVHRIGGCVHRREFSSSFWITLSRLQVLPIDV